MDNLESVQYKMIRLLKQDSKKDDSSTKVFDFFM